MDAERTDSDVPFAESFPDYSLGQLDSQAGLTTDSETNLNPFYELPPFQASQGEIVQPSPSPREDYLSPQFDGLGTDMAQWQNYQPTHRRIPRTSNVQAWHPYSLSSTSERHLNRVNAFSAGENVLETLNIDSPVPRPIRRSATLPTTSLVPPIVAPAADQPQINASYLIAPMPGISTNIPQGTGKIMQLKYLKANKQLPELFVFNAGKDYAKACLIQNGPLSYPRWSETFEYGVGQLVSATNIDVMRWWENSNMRQQQGLDGSYGLMLSLTQSDRRNSLVHAEAFLARLTRRQHVRLAKKGVMETLTNDENRRPNYGIHTNTDLSHAQLVENELTSTNLLKNDSFLNEYQGRRGRFINPVFRFGASSLVFGYIKATSTARTAAWGYRMLKYLKADGGVGFVAWASMLYGKVISFWTTGNEIRTQFKVNDQEAFQRYYQMAKEALQDPEFVEWLNCVWKHAEEQVSRLQPDISGGLVDVEDLDMNENEEDEN